MKPISFIITNYNTKKYTEWCYNSIRKNLGYFHEIVLLDDGSSDGTWELLKEIKKKDIGVKIHGNTKNKGIASSYNKMVELASNEIVCMLHSDMYVPPKFDEIMLKYMEDYDFITPLRVEPPVGYPESVDKVLMNFGNDSSHFKHYDFIKWHEKNMEENQGRVEQRMFFPWMIKKSLYEKINGNDELFSKYMVADDDFYLRIKMSGAKYCQLFETAVYHMPSKSVRMRETDDEIQSGYEHQYQKSIRNFIRKWGCWPAEVWNENRDMIIPNKYDVGFVVKNCDINSLVFLETWCSDIYIVGDDEYIKNYISMEQKNTLYDLKSKIHIIRSIYDTKELDFKNNILVEFDVKELNQERLSFIQQLSNILSNSGEIGLMEYDIFKFNIKSLSECQNDNIDNKSNRRI